MKAQVWKYVLIGAVVAAFLVLLLVRYVVEGWDVHGDEMAPSLPDGSFVLSRRTFGKLDRGDIVVLRSAPDGATNVITRVVGLEGDVITVEGRDVQVDGRRLQREPAPGDGTLVHEILGQSRYLVRLELQQDAPKKTVAVPAGHVFVMADNRTSVRDSRTFGPVSTAQVEYKVLLQMRSHQ